MRPKLFKGAQISFFLSDLRCIYKRPVSFRVVRRSLGAAGDHPSRLDQLVPTTIHLQHQTNNPPDLSGEPKRQPHTFLI
jgi:hypothetical protein